MSSRSPQAVANSKTAFFFFLDRIIFLRVYKPQSLYPFIVQRLPWWLRASEPASACNAGDLGSIPGWEDPLEEEMATYSGIIAWKMPWTEEPGGLQSIRSL